MYICISIYVYAYMFICMYVCMHICMYKYVCMYMHQPLPRRYRERVRMRWHRCLNLRDELKEMGINAGGCSDRRTDYAASIRDDLWAVDIIRNYEKGCGMS